MAGADGVFAVAGIMASTILENPWMSLDVNIRGVQNALEACRYQKVPKIVLSSSAGVYGVMQDDAVTEDTPLRWQAAPPQLVLYSASKIIGESLAQMAHARGGPQWVALRYSAVYGPRQHRRAVMGGHIAESCLRVRRGEGPFIDGDGRQVQDYVYVGDVARANLMAMQSEVSGEGINIVGGEDTSQARIVELVLQAAGSPVTPEYRPYVVTRLPPVTKVGLSREKALRLLGWEPEVSIDQGVRNVLRWVDADLAQSV
jgi:UDP-glucose 4-epimerase